MYDEEVEFEKLHGFRREVTKDSKLLEYVKKEGYLHVGVRWRRGIPAVPGS